MNIRDCVKGGSYRVVMSGFDPDGIHYEMYGQLEGFMRFKGEPVAVFQAGGSFVFLVTPEDIVELEEVKRRYVW
jgi:hypothetical protein